MADDFYTIPVEAHHDEGEASRARRLVARLARSDEERADLLGMLGLVSP
jgi:hypothetical protein